MAIGLGGWSDSFRQFRAGEFCTVKIRRSSPRRCPPFQKGKLNAQNCSLNFVQAKITSNDIVKISPHHPMPSESSQLFREHPIGEPDPACISSRPELLRRLNTTATDVA